MRPLRVSLSNAWEVIELKCTEIGPDTSLLGVLGENIKYTLSPKIHNFAFERLGIRAVYVTFDVSRDRFQRAFPGLLEFTYGLNVTIPYKEAVMPFLDSLSPEAEKVGAVNTIHGVRGYNTDYLAVNGLVSVVERGTALSRGAGGAAKAAAFALGELGFEIIVQNRTETRGMELVSRLREEGISASFSRACQGEYNVVVNTIPEPEAVPLECVRGKMAVEFVYKEETPFLRRARELGMRVVDGLQILVRQAMEAEKIWFGKSLNDIEVVNFLNAGK